METNSSALAVSIASSSSSCFDFFVDRFFDDFCDLSLLRFLASLSPALSSANTKLAASSSTRSFTFTALGVLITCLPSDDVADVDATPQASSASFSRRLPLLVCFELVCFFDERPKPAIKRVYEFRVVVSESLVSLPPASSRSNAGSENEFAFSFADPRFARPTSDEFVATAVAPAITSAPTAKLATTRWVTVHGRDARCRDVPRPTAACVRERR